MVSAIFHPCNVCNLTFCINSPIERSLYWWLSTKLHVVKCSSNLAPNLGQKGKQRYFGAFENYFSESFHFCRYFAILYTVHIPIPHIKQHPLKRLAIYIICIPPYHIIHSLGPCQNTQWLVGCVQLEHKWVHYLHGGPVSALCLCLLQLGRYTNIA